MNPVKVVDRLLEQDERPSPEDMEVHREPPSDDVERRAQWTQEQVDDWDDWISELGARKIMLYPHGSAWDYFADHLVEFMSDFGRIGTLEYIPDTEWLIISADTLTEEERTEIVARWHEFDTLPQVG